LGASPLILASFPIIFSFPKKTLHFLILILIPICFSLWVCMLALPAFYSSAPAKIDAVQYMISIVPNPTLEPGQPYNQTYFSGLMIRSRMLSPDVLKSLANGAFPGQTVECQPNPFYSDDEDFPVKCSVELAAPINITSFPVLDFTLLYYNETEDTSLVQVHLMAPQSTIARLEIQGALLAWSLENETVFNGEQVNTEKISANSNTDWLFTLTLRGAISESNPLMIQAINFYQDQYVATAWETLTSTFDEALTTFSSGLGLARISSEWLMTTTIS